MAAPEEGRRRRHAVAVERPGHVAGVAPPRRELDAAGVEHVAVQLRARAPPGVEALGARPRRPAPARRRAAGRSARARGRRGRCRGRAGRTPPARGVHAGVGAAGAATRGRAPSPAGPARPARCPARCARPRPATASPRSRCRRRRGSTRNAVKRAGARLHRLRPRRAQRAGVGRIGRHLEAQERAPRHAEVDVARRCGRPGCPPRARARRRRPRRRAPRAWTSPVVMTSSTTTTGSPGSRAKPRRRVMTPSWRSVKSPRQPKARATSWATSTPPRAGAHHGAPARGRPAPARSELRERRRRAGWPAPGP